MRNDDENKNMIQATVEDGILHIHTPRKAGFIMENAKATGQKTFRSIEWRQRVNDRIVVRASEELIGRWHYWNVFLSLSSGAATLSDGGGESLLPFRSELFRYHPEQTVSWLYIWWSNNTSASLPEVWQHNPADFEDIQGGRKDRSLSESWNKKRCYFKCLFRQWQKKKRKNETLTFYFHHRKRATRSHTMAQ